MNYPALDLLPQRPPFQFVDTLLSCNENACVSSFLVKEGTLFVHHGFLSEHALLENMAQSIAAAQSFNQQQQQSAPQTGFIGALKKIKILAPTKVGDQLETHIQVLHQIGDAQIATAKIICKDIEIATAELTIFVSSKTT